MASEKKRILQLFYILSKQSGFTRSFELAEKAGVTERTIKSDIKELEDFAQASGARLLSKKSKGYFLEVDDQEIFEPVKNQLHIQFAYVSDLSMKGLKNRTNDILRRIIVEEDFLSIDDISDELYLVRSAIKDEIKQVNDILKSYNLSFRKKCEPGYLIKGSEFDRRMLMLSLFEVHYHEAVTLFKSTDFLKYFDREDEQRYKIRHIFLEVIRNSGFYILDEQKLSRYLCLMSARFHFGHRIMIEDIDRKWIKSFKQYKVARDVLDALSNEFSDFKMDENETCMLALLFLFWNNIPESCDLKSSYMTIYEESSKFTEDFLIQLGKEYGVSLEVIKDSHRILNTAFIPLFCQKRFLATAYGVENSYLIEHQMKGSPLSVYLAKSAADMLKKKYGIQLSLTNLLTIATRIRVIISKIGYSFKPIRAIIASQNGFESTYSMKRSIESRWEKFFECVDVYEFYEMRKLRTDDYDCVILSIPYFSYKYEWPCLLVDDILTQQQMNDIYNQIILKGVQLECVTKEIDIKKIGVFNDFEFDNYESFAKLVSFRMGYSSETISKIELELLNSSKNCCFKKTCILFVNRGYSLHNSLDIYHLKQAKSWRDHEINDIVVISLDFKGNLEIVRFIDNLSYQLMNDTDNIWRVLAKNTSETIVEIVRESLKALPISPK